MNTFSPIQNHILSKLKNAKKLRYSELQLKGIPNDLFNYHLQFLVKKGFVERSEKGYGLARAGIKHVADPDAAKGEEAISNMFKVNAITIISRVHSGRIEILNQIRSSHPSFGKVGVMGGIVRKGERAEDAAIRKLRTETGLEAESFRIIGINRRMMYVDGALFSDIFFPIAYTNSFKGELNDTEFGHNMWVGIDQAIRNEQADFDFIKKIPDVLAAIGKGKIDTMPFFYEEEIQKAEE